MAERLLRETASLALGADIPGKHFARLHRRMLPLRRRNLYRQNLSGPERFERSVDVDVGETLGAKSTSPQPVKFYVPASASEPVEIDVAHSGLRMVLVNREVGPLAA